MAGQIVRAVFKRQIYGEAHYNVMHFRWELAGDDPEIILDNLEAAINTTDTSGLNQLMRSAIQGGSNVVAVGLNLQIIEPIAYDAVEYPFPAYTPTSGEILPTFCAVVHTIRTGFADRSKRGRFFIGGIPEAQTTGNVISSTYAAIHSGIDVALMRWFHPDGTDYSGFRFGVWSRKNQEFTPGTGSSYSTVISTLRRRKAGRGI